MSQPMTEAERVAARRAEALKSGGDFMKLLTSLATGALVFSVGLLPNSETYAGAIRFLLLASWMLLLLAVGLGLLAQAAIPPMINDGTSDIEAWYFRRPVQGQQIAFGAALLVLAAALVCIMFGRAPYGAVRSAAEAVERARAGLPAGTTVLGLEQVQPIASGLGLARYGSWRVQFDVAGVPAKLDVLIDARSGRLLLVP